MSRETKHGAAKSGAPDKACLLRFFRAHTGEVVRREDLTREFGDPRKWMPSLAALRQRDGYPLQSYRDGLGLGRNEYLLATLKRRPILARNLSAEGRRIALAATDLACRYCGACPSDPDLSSPGHSVRLRVSLLIPEEQGGPVVPENLQAACLTCLEGRKKAPLPSPPSLRTLLITVRRADPVDQVALLEWLGARYGKLALRLLQGQPVSSDGRAEEKGQVPAARRRGER